MAWQQNEWFGALAPEGARPGLRALLCTSLMLHDLGDVLL